MTTAKIPITIVTGFLGSGKTTLIRNLLTQGDADGTLVIVNEFGEVDIDHDLLEASSDDTILLANGCLCCTIRGNLVDTLNDVLAQREAKRLRTFDWVVVETSGVANPAYLIAFLFSDATIAARYRLAQVVTTCDAIAGADILARFAEAQDQIRVADRLLITKTDLADPAAIAKLTGGLRALNATAPIAQVIQGAIDPALLLTTAIPNLDQTSEGAAPAHDHADRFTATALIAGRPLSNVEIKALLDAVAAYAGPHLLRLKAVLACKERTEHAVIQASLMVTHPLEFVTAAAIHRQGAGQLVFITDGLAPAALIAALAPLGFEPSYRGPG